MSDLTANATPARLTRPPGDLVIDIAYLRTLGRLPSDAERQSSVKYLTETSSPSAALRDLLWALVNTKEFVVNH